MPIFSIDNAGKGGCKRKWKSDARYPSKRCVKYYKNHLFSHEGCGSFF
jgi:hypothetical protein